MIRLYLAGAVVLTAVAAFYWIRADAANDREKQIRQETIERVVIDIREDAKSDRKIDGASDDDLRRQLNRWLRH